MKILLLIVIFCISPSVIGETFDLKATMQEMKIEFKKAVDANEIESSSIAVERISELISLAQKQTFSPENHETYQEGFQKLSDTLILVESKLEKGDLSAAKDYLKRIDELRVEYHDRRSPSLWDLIFG